MSLCVGVRGEGGRDVCACVCLCVCVWVHACKGVGKNLWERQDKKLERKAGAR